jgi:hypothetical protein
MAIAFGGNDLAQLEGRTVFLRANLNRGAAHQLSALTKKELESWSQPGYSLQHITQFLSRQIVYFYRGTRMGSLCL